MRIARWFLLVLVAVLVSVYVEQARWVYPTPETQSIFLKTYTPKQVLDRFAAVQTMQVASDRGDGAQVGFVTHKENIEPTLSIRSGDWVALNQALRDDIAARLTAQGADILQESGNAPDGFKLQYAMGKSEGTVTLEPLKSLPGSPLGPGVSAPGTVTVRAHIQIEENWFKAGRKGTAKVASLR